MPVHVRSRFPICGRSIATTVFVQPSANQFVYIFLVKDLPFGWQATTQRVLKIVGDELGEFTTCRAVAFELGNHKFNVGAKFVDSSVKNTNLLRKTGAGQFQGTI